jgi:hypothetical protein
MISPSLSPKHSRAMLEPTFGPLTKLVAMLENDQPRLARLRAELEKQLEVIFTDNHLTQGYLLSRATKKEALADDHSEPVATAYVKH